MGVCLRVLKESNKSRFDSYSVRNSVLIISHITFQGSQSAHFFQQPFSKQLYTGIPLSVDTRLERRLYSAIISIINIFIDRYVSICIYNEVKLRYKQKPIALICQMRLVRFDLKNKPSSEADRDKLRQRSCQNDKNVVTAARGVARLKVGYVLVSQKSPLLLWLNSQTMIYKQILYFSVEITSFNCKYEFFTRGYFISSEMIRMCI